MLRLLDSWIYVNGEPTSGEPNTKQFLLGSIPNWSLIGQERRFIRDIEEDLWTWTTDFITDSKAKSTSVLVTGAAGYGITTILMGLALKIVAARNGPVFMLKEGAEVNEADVAYAASLFTEVPAYFIVDQAREHAQGFVALAAAAKHCITIAFSFWASGAMSGYRASYSRPGKYSKLNPCLTEKSTVCLTILAQRELLANCASSSEIFNSASSRISMSSNLLVAMREATAGAGVGFDAIIESEFQGIRSGQSKVTSETDVPPCVLFLSAWHC